MNKILSLSITLLFFFVNTSNAQQLPKELKGKWEGDIIVLEKSGNISGEFKIGVGNWEAETNNQIEFSIRDFSATKRDLFQYVNAVFKSGQESGFVFDYYIFTDGNSGVATGQYDFTLMPYNNKTNCLLAGFAGKDNASGKEIKAIAVLFKSKDYKTLKNSQEYNAFVSDILNQMDEMENASEISDNVLPEQDMTNNTAEELTPVAEKLFTGVNSKLTNKEKNEAANSVEFQISGSLFTLNRSHEEPFEVYTYPVDLNQDGVEEVVFEWGVEYVQGNPLSNYFIVTKDKQSGIYKKNSGFSGILSILKSKTNGYLDIVNGGPGFSFPIYKWNGNKYESRGNISDDYLKTNPFSNLEKVSQEYQQE